MQRRKKESTDKKVVSENLLVIGISIFICLCILAYAIYRLYSGFRDYDVADAIYSNAQSQYVLMNYSDKPDSSKGSSGLSEDNLNPLDNEDGEFHWYNIVDVNFTELRNVNSEVCGWLYFEDEDISYPIMYSGNNTKYLDHDYTGSSLRSGAIFVDGSNNSDFGDAHTLIYGHNMHDTSMFGKLNNYKTDNDYYEGHKYFQIITPTKKIRYEIVAYKDVPADGYIYTTYGKNASGFVGFALNYVFKNSYIQPNVEVNDNTQIVTLSTCSGSDNIRFVVSAVKIDEY